MSATRAVSQLDSKQGRRAIFPRDPDQAGKGGLFANTVALVRDGVILV